MLRARRPATDGQAPPEVRANRSRPVVAETASRLRFTGLTSGGVELGTFLSIEVRSLGVKGGASLWATLLECAAASRNFSHLISMTCSSAPAAAGPRGRAPRCRETVANHRRRRLNVGPGWQDCGDVLNNKSTRSSGTVYGQLALPPTRDRAACGRRWLRRYRATPRACREINHFRRIAPLIQTYRKASQST